MTESGLGAALSVTQELLRVLSRLERTSVPQGPSDSVTLAMGMLCSAILELCQAIMEQASRGHALVCAILVRSLEDGFRRLRTVTDDEGAARFLASQYWEEMKVLRELERDATGEAERRVIRRKREELEAVGARVDKGLLEGARGALSSPRAEPGTESAAYHYHSAAVHLGPLAVHRYAEEGRRGFRFGPRPDYVEAARILIRAATYCLMAFQVYDQVSGSGLRDELERIAERLRVTMRDLSRTDGRAL